MGINQLGSSGIHLACAEVDVKGHIASERWHQNVKSHQNSYQAKAIQRKILAESYQANC